MPSQRRRATLAGVDQLRPGDQAFTTFADDAERLTVLGLFTRLGLARGEKVILSLDTSRPPDEVAAEIAGGADAARDALGRGQLVLSKVPPFLDDPPRAGSGEIADRARAWLEDAAAEGFSGIRAGCDLSGALDSRGGMRRLVELERATHRELMAADTWSRFTVLCQWDERLLVTEADLDEVRWVHPVTVLPAPPELRVTRTPNGILLTGDSDLACREEFAAALRTLEDIRPPEGPLVLDLSKMSFLDAHSVGAVLRLAARLPPPRRIEVRCREHHRRMLNVLGAHTVSQLTIITRGR
ncbi:MAG: MEDS domain-containing protein [Streptosporangiales bacterium]|nr:MEDS domain-containing protein [Streptosporangiales bacterium]